MVPHVPAGGLAITGVVLAGGESRRMGRDKRFLEIDGIPLLDRVLVRLRPVVSELIVVTAAPEPRIGVDVRVVTDRFPGMGVLAGVHAGLSAAQNPWALVVAGDMPLLNPNLLRAMARRAEADGCDLVVPRWRGMLEPLHALYRACPCASAAERALKLGRRRIIAFYPEVRVCEMSDSEVRQWDPEGDSFVNVNTPDEWRQVRNRFGA